ncbi:Piwi-like protein 1 [Mactra antiquata]
MTGRARGRARGRSRGATEDAASRPGDAQAQAPQPVQQVVAPNNGNGNGPPPASGRASYRGGSREQKPGMTSAGGASAPADEIAKLSIGGGDARQRRRRNDEGVHTRPAHIADKTGSSGTPIPLMTNYFALEQAPDWHLYQYRVDFSPDVDSKKLRIALLYHHEELLGRTKAFDGMTLFLPRKLPPETEVYSKRQYDNENIKITIKLTNELPPNSPQCIQVYNIIFRRVLGAIQMQQIGRNYYNPAQAVDIPQHKLRVMPGFIASILQYENNVLLNCDISHKILRSDTVLDIMYDLYHRSGDRFSVDCEKKLVGQIILTKYNNKTYRIDDIDWNKKPHDTFQLRDGSRISYKDYYQKSYGIPVTDPDQPLLASKPTAKDKRRDKLQGKEVSENLYFLPELCVLTGLSDDVRSDYSVMKDVAQHTRVAPSGRERTLTGFINQLNRNEKVRQEMGGWGLRFSDSLVPANARIMPKERVLQDGGAELIYKAEDADWSRDMRGKKLITSVHLQNWCVIFFKRNNGQAQDFVQTLSRVGPPMGMRIGAPHPVELHDDKNESYLTALRQNMTGDTQLVMCIVPTNKKDRYDAIKKFTCVDHPVPSQVIVSRTLSKKQMMMSVATKVAIQLNCKLGGEVWALEIPLKNIMVVGIDTYHDSAKKGQSVVGFIASMNKNLTRYYSRVTFQSAKLELADSIMICYKGALEKYHEVNGCLPERIIVYRDGVGDGQLAAVSEHEVPQMLTAFKKAGGESYSPKVAVVVVKKRINSRFFARAGPGVTNPPPGTVVDSVVTKPEWYDFFIVSQSVKQGTVTPTHYNIIYDNTGLRPDHMQRLTYKLCHLYYNWPGTIRVPAPCQYAHKLAFLVGQSIHRDPAIELSDRLYFL